jgi:hypothetical protein
MSKVDSLDAWRGVWVQFLGREFARHVWPVGWDRDRRLLSVGCGSDEWVGWAMLMRDALPVRARLAGFREDVMRLEVVGLCVRQDV